jgi:type IV pilus assembly protein PilA
MVLLQLEETAMRCTLTHFSISNKRGFTLIELLMVVAILGVLATIAIKRVSEERMKANDTQAISLMRNILTAMETQLPQPGDLIVAAGGGTLAWADSPPLQIGPQLFVLIAEDTDGFAEGKWQVFGAHAGGKLGFYFWVPSESCTVEEDDHITDSGGHSTPADRIVPNFAEKDEYIYTVFRNTAGI